MQKNPNFYVLFDTNSIWVDGPFDFVNRRVISALGGVTNRADVPVSLCLANVVKEERRYQLETAAMQLIGPIRRAQRLTGRSFDLGEHDLKGAVTNQIEQSISKLQLAEVQIDPAKVNWHRLIEKSLKREAPFAQGGIEKGFRDAILLETFMQVAEQRITEDPTNRVVLVCADKRLGEAVDERLQQAGLKNAMCVQNFDELVTIINAVPADLKEEEIERLVRKASELFYNASERSGLFITSDVQLRIATEHRSAINNPPSDAPFGSNVRFDHFEVSPTIFLSRTGDELKFLTKVVAVVRLAVPDPYFSSSTSFPTYVSSIPSGTTTYSSSAATSSPTVFSTSTGSPLGIGSSNGTIVSTGAPFTSWAGTSPTAGSSFSVSTYSTGSNTLYFVARERSGRHQFDVVWTSVLKGNELVTPQVRSLAIQAPDWDAN